MATVPTIVAPEIQEDERLRPSLNYQVIREVRDRWNPLIVIDNVRFVHDAHWRENRIFSIQAAHDWNKSLFWTCVALAFYLGQLAFTLGPLIWWLL